MKKVDILPRSKIRINVTTAIYRENGHSSEEVEELFISKDSGMISGVYEIRNKRTGERYIGMSRNLRRRFLRHKDELVKGIHHCVLLQKVFLDEIKIALKNQVMCAEPDYYFEFNVIVYCRPSELTYWEHKLIKAIKPEYNTHMENGHSRARIVQFGCDPDEKSFGNSHLYNSETNTIDSINDGEVIAKYRLAEKENENGN